MTPKFRYQSSKGHRPDPAPFPIDLGGFQTNGLFCAECGFDLESAPRGKFFHLTTRDGAAWLDRQGDAR